MRVWLAIALQHPVRQRALKVAAVVGSILVVINQGDVLLAGNAPLKTWIQIVLTFLVPYCVSTYASVQAIRQLSAAIASTSVASKDAGGKDVRSSS
jgi:hypothetical protein